MDLKFNSIYNGLLIVTYISYKRLMFKKKENWLWGMHEPSVLSLQLFHSLPTPSGESCFLSLVYMGCKVRNLASGFYWSNSIKSRSSLQHWLSSLLKITSQFNVTLISVLLPCFKHSSPFLSKHPALKCLSWSWLPGSLDKPLPVRIHSSHLQGCGQLCSLSLFSCHVTFIIQNSIYSLESHLIEEFLVWCKWLVHIHTKLYSATKI